MLKIELPFWSLDLISCYSHQPVTLELKNVKYIYMVENIFTECDCLVATLVDRSVVNSHKHKCNLLWFTLLKCHTQDLLVPNLHCTVYFYLSHCTDVYCIFSMCIKWKKLYVFFILVIPPNNFNGSLTHIYNNSKKGKTGGTGWKISNAVWYPNKNNLKKGLYLSTMTL